jgi:GTP-binding protein
MDFRYKHKYEAENGEDGRKKKQSGKSGADCIIRVPVGTVLIDKVSGAILCDLAESGDHYTALTGGRGGKGNVHFKSSTRQAPNFAEAGGKARQREIQLELKLLADVGLIGFPNVGKSTLLSVFTEAQPKIDNYPFTTLYPNLGVVDLYEQRFIIADIPGLIEGAHTGAGLGLDFLRHIERTRLLVHLIDMSVETGRKPIEDFEIIQHELAAYSPALAEKSQIIALNKIDMADPEQTDRLLDYLKAKNLPVYLIAAALHQGVDELLAAIAQKLAELPPPERMTYDVVAAADVEDAPGYRDLKWRKVDDVYELEGEQLEKIFNSTNFNDMGSRRYLYRYIERKGGIEGLKRLGLKDGDTVRISNSEFVFLEEENGGQS